MSVYALIPARVGSKGIPGKNLRMLGGRELLAWSISSAFESKACDQVWVSAGSDLIASRATLHGAQAFVRPWELSGDDVPMLPVVRHAILHLGLGWTDIVVLLQPTGPFRSLESIRRCVAVLQDEPMTDSAFTVVPVPLRYHPSQIVARGAKYPACRQTLAPVYVRAGTVYAFRASTVERHGDIYGREYALIEVGEEEAANLDTESDWTEAEWRIERNGECQASPSGVQPTPRAPGHPAGCAPYRA